ncbi:MAG TPA: hypothetical protein VFN50_13400 [Acidimicrobiales bacterium]|nr:hypothetical protein [Acidimicrobiales bacterium]
MTRAELEEERTYLHRSIDDLDREHSAGDVSEQDYRRLVVRYRRQLDKVEAALSGLGDEAAGIGAAAPRPRRPQGPRRGRSRLAGRRTRLVTGWAAFSCFAAAAAFLGMAVAKAGPFAGPPRVPVDAQVQVMLTEASLLAARGDLTQALAVYDQVLALRPTEPEALADGGWLARLAGIAQHNSSLVRNGDAEIEAAVQSDPRYALAHAYDGVLLLRDRHEPRLAVAQFDRMLAEHPSATLLWSVKQDALAAYEAVGRPAPRLIAAATKPASSTS